MAGNLPWAPNHDRSEPIAMGKLPKRTMAIDLIRSFVFDLTVPP